MIRQTPFIYSLFCFILIISISCKKTNETYPEVEILSPSEGTSYSYGDTIFLEVEVINSSSDLFVSVQDGTQNLGLSYSKKSTNGSIYSFEIYFNNSYIESGGYSIRVSASNGGNSKSDFKTIYLNERPLKLVGMITLSSNTSSGTLSFRDSTGSMEEASLYGDFNYLEYNSRQKRGVLAPRSTGKLEGYSVYPLSKEFALSQNSSLGESLYNDLVDDGQYIYSLAGNGGIKALDADGNIVQFFTTAPNLEPMNGCFGEDGLFISVKERGLENYFVQLLNPTNGSVQKNKAAVGEVKDVVWVKQDLFVLASLVSNQTSILSYQPSTNTLTQMFTLPDEPICMVTDFTGLILLSTSKNIYQINPQSGSLPSLVYNFSATDMEFDLPSNSVFISSGFTVYKGSMSGGVKRTFQYPHTIKQLELVYNK